MDGIIIAFIGLLGGLTTAVTSIIINRANRRDAKEDKSEAMFQELSKLIDERLGGIETRISNLADMCVKSVGDKLRHYGNKYLAIPDIATAKNVDDWLILEESYHIAGGNHHAHELRPKMEALLQQLELEEQRDK